MENDAVKVYEEPGIEVADAKTPKKSSPRIPDEVFVPVTVDDDDSRRDKEGFRRRGLLPCCCCSSHRENKDLEPAGSTAAFQQENRHHIKMPSKGVRQETKSFLNSAAYYVFIIVLTFVITIFLFVELFIDAGLLHVVLPSDATSEEMDKNEQETKNVSTALHWFSFAILGLFFIEIILRVIVKRMELVKDLVSIFDCIIVFVAFVANLCVTLIAGSHSPIDAISLIIILRLIRIYSLVKVRVRIVKKRSKFHLDETEAELASANITISSLRRQIMDKDFEIKQLHAYLGGGVTDPQLSDAIKASKEDIGGKAAAADKELEMAIALSKQDFIKENGVIEGELNRAFSNSETNEDNYGVLIHTNPKRLNRQVSDPESGIQMTSYIEEYFSKVSKNGLSPGQGLEGVSPGARRKNKQASLDITSKGYSTLISHDKTTIELLPKTSDASEPVTICVDPDILLCDEKEIARVSNDVKYHADAESGVSTDNLSDAVNREPPSVNRDQSMMSNGDIDKSSDGRVSSPELPSDSDANTQAKSTVSAWIKNSGSSLGSESGYQSEDLSLNANGKLTLPGDTNSNGIGMHSSDMELTAM